jgi:hypothetical protein
MLDSIGSNPNPDSREWRTENSAPPPNRAVKDSTIEWEVRDISRRYKRWRKTAVESALQVIDLGERLVRLKRHVEEAYGPDHWTGFVDAQSDFPALRTAQKFMAGFKAKDDALLSTDPAAWLAKIWNNTATAKKPKRLKGVSDD